MKTGIDVIGVSTSFYCHDANGRWLLHKRSNNCRDEKGAWDSGGGKLEFGLTLEENVLKEIREEYNCNAIIQRQLPAITLLRKSSEGALTHWIIIPFILEISPLEIQKVQIGDVEKMSEYGWFTFENLPHPLHTGFQKTTKLYRPIFQEYSITS
ncbi:MAG: NUDIX domain-containing protein [Candidatus Roizmanbacteria bacterium]|nr:NUDIX domain-containing protein [Candidatus Roizmanbacteria bacterium]